MELLDRYLQAVKKHLPWQRQDDIIAELRANLEAQLEDKEAELGRPLTKDEAEQWLKQLGSPIQVAARYQRQQYLIGPALFPTYWYVLKLVFFWLTTVYVVARVITVAAQGSSAEAYAGIALGLPWIWLVNAAIITLVFAVIELSGSRWGVKIPQIPPMGAGWTPLDLPAVGEGDDENKPWSFAKAMAEVIFGCLFFAWLLLVPHYPYLMFGPGAWYLASLPYTLAHAWWPFYWCIVGINGFELMWKIADLTGGAWHQRKQWRHWAMHSLSLIPLGILLAAPGQQLFLAKDAAAKVGHPQILKLGESSLAAINKMQRTERKAGQPNRPGVSRQVVRNEEFDMNNLRQNSSTQFVSGTRELVRGQEQEILAELMPLVHSQSVLLDLSSTERIDAAGLAALISLYCEACAAGHEFAVINPPRRIARVLALVGLDRVLGSEGSEECRRQGLVAA